MLGIGFVLVDLPVLISDFIVRVFTLGVYGLTLTPREDHLYFGSLVSGMIASPRAASLYASTLVGSQRFKAD
jgi:hypothetical protein